MSTTVHVVDHSAAQPPLPPRLSQGPRRIGAAQTLLLLLVSVALCAMAIKAIVYLLYQPGPVPSVPSTPPPELVGGKEVTSPSFRIPGSKPAALLTDGPDAAHGPQIMKWSTDHIPLLHEMDYKKGSLIIQRDGVYYVYSKVHFLDSGEFYHSLVWLSTAYPTSVTVLQSRKSSPWSNETISSSYLGGVFEFGKDDALYVEVSNTTKIKRLGPFENVFGAYMI